MNLHTPILNAPVKEAIFEVQVELPFVVTPEDLEKLCNEVKQDYPKKQSRKRFEGLIEMKKEGPSTSETIDLGVDGFISWSEDDTQVVQFRLDGYSFSRLKPYNRWEEHFPEVVKLWGLYSRAVFPIRIKRIAIRFINVIQVPRESELQDYFINFPKLPSDKSLLSNFFNRIEFSLSDKNITAVVTQALTSSNDPMSKPIILDIEASQEINSQINENTVVEVFQVLREVKNDIFKKSLTEKAGELFR